MQARSHATCAACDTVTFALSLDRSRASPQATLRSLFVQSNLLVALPPEICRCQALQVHLVRVHNLAHECVHARAFGTVFALHLVP